jgi:hypothetical protein
MKKKLTYFLILTLALGSFVFPGNTARAESSSVQKALENVKQQLDDLVTAKDDSNLNDLALRIETFKKVIDFSITEAKDLKIKTLALDLDKNLQDWQKSVLAGLDDAITYYNDQKQSLKETEIGSLEEIKGTAESFKKWREDHYLGTANQVRDFILIDQEQKSIQTAQKRSQKINDDLKKLEKAKIKGVSELYKLIGKANQSIKEADEMNQKATKLFFEKYIPIVTSTTPTATSTATSTINLPETNSIVTSTETRNVNPAASSTEEAIPPLPPSIKDLVDASLTKVKETYQIFIDMSNLVRKLLK